MKRRRYAVQPFVITNITQALNCRQGVFTSHVDRMTPKQRQQQDEMETRNDAFIRALQMWKTYKSVDVMDHLIYGMEGKDKRRKCDSIRESLLKEVLCSEWNQAWPSSKISLHELLYSVYLLKARLMQWKSAQTKDNFNRVFDSYAFLHYNVENEKFRRRLKEQVQKYDALLLQAFNELAEDYSADDAWRHYQSSATL